MQRHLGTYKLSVVLFGHLRPQPQIKDEEPIVGVPVDLVQDDEADDDPVVAEDDDDDDDAVVAVSWWRAVGVFELLGRLDCCRSVRHHHHSSVCSFYNPLHCTAMHCK